ncbi:hypothetical protein [Mesorhizobium caraganae]|uniref:hypothetical protein n=1 Tax=Mesorhizobium caraganae TaxID=483206 RepID=UPI00177B15EE|nr:hypothetical protein [Mesorhizobium caraganae]
MNCPADWGCLSLIIDYFAAYADAKRPSPSLRCQGRIPQNRVPPSPSMVVPAEINPPSLDRGKHLGIILATLTLISDGRASAGREMRLLSLRAMIAHR